MDYKRILTIQDISCLGQCSLTVALPVLSACGYETCILPTALLSTHTGGFQNPFITQLSESMAGIREHWQRENFRFDAIYTGYLGSVEAIQETEKIVETLLAPGGTFIVDPAMADNGQLYSGFDDAYAQAMAGLCRKADMILPNITEAAILTGLPYEEHLTEEYVNQLLNKLDHPCIALTGVGFRENETGVAILDHGKRWDYRHRKFQRMCHGAGDLFASCFVGAFLRGKSLAEAAQISADMVCDSIAATLDCPEHWYGVKFETVIPELLQRLNEKEMLPDEEREDH